MFFLIIGTIFLILFAVSFIKEKRRFRNSIYLLCTIINMYLYAMIILTHSSARIINLLLAFLLFLGMPISVIVTSILFIIAGIITIRREGFRISNLLSIIFGSGIWITFLLLGLISTGKFKSKLLIGITSFSVIATLYIGFTFVALLLYSWLYSILPKKNNYDYIIIHGAGLSGGKKVTPLLAKRLDKGIEAYIKFEKRPKLIVSGGKGSDEKLSEAEAMKIYLLGKNINEEDIICEDKSTTTLENLQFSKKLMDAEKENYKCLFVTNNYHVFRTGLYAKKVNLNAEGLGCKTALYYWPGAFIREYIAIMWSMKRYSISILGTSLLIITLTLIL